MIGLTLALALQIPLGGVTVASSSGAIISLSAHTSAGAKNSAHATTGCTTACGNSNNTPQVTTGATSLFVCSSFFHSGNGYRTWDSPTGGDPASATNTWNALSNPTAGVGADTRCGYAGATLSTGSTHTVADDNTSNFPTAAFFVFAGTQTAVGTGAGKVIDQDTAASNASSVTTINTISQTPTTSHEGLISCVGFDGNPGTVSAANGATNYPVTEFVVYSSGNNEALYCVVQVDVTAAQQVVWTWTNALPVSETQTLINHQ